MNFAEGKGRGGVGPTSKRDQKCRTFLMWVFFELCAKTSVGWKLGWEIWLGSSFLWHT